MTIRWTYHNRMQYLQYAIFDGIPGLWHGILTRIAIDPKMGRTDFHVPGLPMDEEPAVSVSHEQMLALTGASQMVFARQVHGTQVAVWDQAAAQNVTDGHRRVAVAGDAIVTDRPETALVIRTADCQSVLIVDPRKGVIGNVHSGWRGSVANIVDATIQTMASRFGCRPEHMVCGIGPSLGPCCAEFVNYRDEIPKRYWSYRKENNHFDFWQLSRDQLTAAGVPQRQIAVSGLCTRCNRHAFYSYRGEQQTTGRFAAIIRLNGNQSAR